MAHIVVGVDRSPGSGYALRWALAEAARTGSLLSAVHVWHLPVSTEVPLSTATAGALRANLDGSRSGGVAIQPQTTAWAVEGDPGPVLVKRAEHADLLVVGGRQGGGFFRGANGRVTSYCLHHATAPVVVVPCHELDPGTAGGQSRIVVGVDSSDGSHHALRWAARAARQRDAPLVAVHAWQLSPGSLADVVHPAHALPGQESRAMERLRSWVREALGDEAGIPVEFTLGHGSPLDHLREQAATAHMVVLGAVGTARCTGC